MGVMLRCPLVFGSYIVHFFLSSCHPGEFHMYKLIILMTTSDDFSHCSTENILDAILLTILLFQTWAELPVSEHKFYFKQTKQQESKCYYCISSQYCQSTIELSLTGCSEGKITLNSWWGKGRDQSTWKSAWKFCIIVMKDVRVLV